MKIQDYKEGIYINKNGEDIIEIVFKYVSDNSPHLYFGATSRDLNTFTYGDFMENYVFCCEF